jgi:hypothetical protein
LKYKLIYKIPIEPPVEYGSETFSWGNRNKRKEKIRNFRPLIRFTGIDEKVKGNIRVMKGRAGIAQSVQ